MYSDCNERDCTSNKNIVDMHRQMFESLISAGVIEELPGYVNANVIVRSYDMEEHAKKCARRYFERASKNVEQLQNVSTVGIDDHQLKTDEMTTVGDLSKVCSRVVRTCLYLARIVRRDSLWSVNKLVRAVTKWTKEPVTELHDIGGGRSCARGRFFPGHTTMQLLQTGTSPPLNGPLSSSCRCATTSTGATRRTKRYADKVLGAGRFSDVDAKESDIRLSRANLKEN